MISSFKNLEDIIYCELKPKNFIEKENNCCLFFKKKVYVNNKNIYCGKKIVGCLTRDSSDDNDNSKFINTLIGKSKFSWDNEYFVYVNQFMNYLFVSTNKSKVYIFSLRNLRNLRNFVQEKVLRNFGCTYGVLKLYEDIIWNERNIFLLKRKMNSSLLYSSSNKIISLIKTNYNWIIFLTKKEDEIMLNCLKDDILCYQQKVNSCCKKLLYNKDLYNKNTIIVF